MRSAETQTQYTGQHPRGQQILAIISGWQAEDHPVHRALEREAAEAIDQAERDHAARVTYARRGAR
jgi:hypothetical protein